LGGRWLVGGVDSIACPIDIVTSNSVIMKPRVRVVDSVPYTATMKRAGKNRDVSCNYVIHVCWTLLVKYRLSAGTQRSWL
jgi:hypothetical protein